jgi:hypothetical protein
MDAQGVVIHVQEAVDPIVVDVQVLVLEVVGNRVAMDVLVHVVVLVQDLV